VEAVVGVAVMASSRWIYAKKIFLKF
jgi:hypothetical protein